MEISVREARPEDAYSLIRMMIPEMNSRTDEELNEGEYFPKWRANFLQMLSEPLVKVFVAVSGEDVIGLTTAYLLPRVELAGYYSVVEDVFVKESERSKGIGKLIFEEVIKYLKTANAKNVVLCVANDNVKAQQFYERLGFKQDSVGMKLDL